MPKYFLVLLEHVDVGRKSETVEILTRSQIRGLSLRGLKKKKVIPLAPPHIDIRSQCILEAMLAFSEVVSGEYRCEETLEEILNIARKM